LCLFVLTQCVFLPGRSEAGLNLAHKAFVIVPLFSSTVAGVAPDFQKAKSAFSEPPIVVLLSPPRGVVFDFQKEKSAFSELRNVLQFPKVGGASDFQKAESPFSDPPILLLFFLTEEGA